MKRNKCTVPLLISLTLFVLSACNSATSIDSITIDGIDLQVISASLHESYMIGAQEYSPRSSSDLLLLVRAKISDTDSELDLSNWEAQVQDESGRVSNSDISSKITGTIEGQEGTFLEWFFVVDRNVKEVTIIIRDHELDISPILNQSSED